MLLSQLVVIAVVVSRFLVPLAIPRFPVPGLVAALVLDAVDQTVFQQFPGLDLTGYQGYDKALDVYYLTIAYAATLRNWTDRTAFRIGRFLWYWRLVGVVAFELTGARWLLVVFPNTFEYFFLAYEVVRLAWRPTRLGPRHLLGLAAGIWVVVKLPQEWWIHVARLDLTDAVKEGLLAAPADAGWGAALRGAPEVLVGTALLGSALVGVGVVVVRRLPPPDWPASVDVDSYDPRADVVVVPASFRRGLGALPGRRLLEKSVLIALVAVVFAEVLPGVRASRPEIALAVAVLVAVNSVVGSWWLAGRGSEWTSTARQFAALLVIDGGVLLGYVLLPGRTRALDPVNTAAFLLLFCLLITLYDRYRNLRSVRDRVAPALSEAP